MKKLLSAVIAGILSISTMSFVTFADEELSANVNVTISDKDGKIVLAQENIKTTDIDNDGELTINDVLYIAHEEKFEGGAAAGYASSLTQYGLTMDKLWGTENGGSYGYYLNNSGAWNLTDKVSEGDFVNAFVYTDLVAYSDTYCWFDINSTDKNKDDEITLTLTSLSYSPDTYEPVHNPVKNAVITINGTASEYKTDDEGKVTIKVNSEGKNVISATSETQNLVPPVCIVNIAAESIVTTITEEITTTAAETTTTAAATTTAAETTTTAASTTTAATTTIAKTNSSPNTGDSGAGIAVSLMAISAISIAASRRKNEK